MILSRHVWPWGFWCFRTDSNQKCTLWWMWILLRHLWVYFVLCLHSTVPQFSPVQSPCFPHFYLHPRRPLWEEPDPAVCVPCAALPAVRQGTDSGRLTAGSPAAPPWSAVICCPVSHSRCGSQCRHWQAILDWNSCFPLSNQTNTTLKVNKNPERGTDNIRAADSLFAGWPGWK